MYSPKLHHAAIAAIICIVLIAISGKAQGRVLLALNIGALIFAFMTAVILALIVLESLNERVRVMTDWMAEFGKLDDEARAAVAFAFPTMRYRMKRGVVRELFEDTSVPMETFRMFLKTSNARYISPERDWSTKEMPRWAWLEIKQWLQDNDYILPDSAAGSHSWLWHGNAYNHLMVYWMAGRLLAEEPRDAVYAYEEN